jgi:DNA mismatch repair protein MutS2
MAELMEQAPPLVDRKTLSDLGFDEIVAAVCGKITFEPARRLAEGLLPIPDAGERKRSGSLVEELVRLEETPGQGVGDPFSLDLGSMEDPAALLGRLEKGGTLTGEELLKVEKLIPAFRKLSETLKRSSASVPGLRRMLRAACDDEAEAGALEDISLEIASILDEEGSIKDSATTELRQLRARQRGLRSEMAEKVKAQMETCAGHLQDDFYTIREGRYVLPIRADARVNVRGIIHGYSQSGATVYIEPQVLVDDCNQLKVLEGEIQAEEEKILAGLSRLLGGHAETLGRIASLLSTWDYFCAIVRFGGQIGGRPARLSDDPVLRLRSARHPLLALRGVDVVPNDVELEAGQGWVISGPNAGGKTVLLKTAGLIILMAYCGIPVPAAEGSVVGSFESIRSVIGDDQSVARSLSTFSAQVRGLADALAVASPRSLVLLDELATGTEPQEGSALAREILLELVLEKGAAVMVATHFESLKLLSISHEKFVAAGMGFDFDTLSPTFRVNLGIPGISGGLVVAGKYGLPLDIVTRARRFIEGSGDQLTVRIEEIENMRKQLQKELEGLESKKKEIKGKEKEIEEIKKKLIDRKRRELTAQEAYLTSELKLLHGELKEAHRLLRRRPLSKAAVSSSARTAGRVGGLLAPEGKLTRLLRQGPELSRPGPSSLTPGRKVFIPKLGLEGLLEGFEGKKARIRSGGKSIIVPTEDIFLPGEEKIMTMEKDKSGSGADAGEEGEREMDEYQNPYNTLDVRGKALDEALIEIDAFVDTMLEMGLKKGYIIHGHGTGVLKNGIRRHMRHLKPVESFKPGGPGEGGDGCTVVKIRQQ